MPPTQSFVQRVFQFSKTNRKDLFFGFVALTAVAVVAHSELCKSGVVSPRALDSELCDPQSNFRVKRSSRS